MIYFYLHCVIVFSLFRYYLSSKWYEWDPSCRDNNGRPVDWWYIYKPPKGCDGKSDFIYMTSNLSRRLLPSKTPIYNNSMLQLTLASVYSKRLKADMAVMSYGEIEPTIDDIDSLPTSTASGILFANIFSGVWMSHTLPGFPNLMLKGPPLISEEDSIKGHMFMCVSLDLENVDLIATAITHTETKMIKFYFPNSLKTSLPKWAHIKQERKKKPSETDTNSTSFKTKTKYVKFSTKNKTLEGLILARGPEDTRCLYEMFAKMQGIVLDVYNHRNVYGKPICQKDYSLRYIEKISLKSQGYVCYTQRNMDKTSFGVSTGALWQRRSRKLAHWACMGNHDLRAYQTKGGMISCVNKFKLWFSFDNFKTKEPDC